MGIALYQRFTLAEASLFFAVSAGRFEESGQRPENRLYLGH